MRQRRCVASSSNWLRIALSHEKPAATNRCAAYRPDAWRVHGQSEIKRYYRAENSGAFDDCTIPLASGEKRGGQEVSGQWQPRRARNGGWYNAPTPGQMVRHRPLGRETVADFCGKPERTSNIGFCGRKHSASVNKRTKANIMARWASCVPPGAGRSSRSDLYGLGPRPLETYAKNPRFSCSLRKQFARGLKGRT